MHNQQKKPEPLGGRTVVEEKLLEGFDAAVGLHVNTEIPVGSYGRCGFAPCAIVPISSTANFGVDAISKAGAFINEVQKVVSREMPVDDGAVVTIGTIRGGEAPNIICPSVVITGTI